MAVIKCPSCGTQINVPEKKTGMWWGIGCLIAAAGIPFLVAIIGLLAAIAIPSFVKARNTAQFNGCINNMRVIDSAKEQAALKYRYQNGHTVSEQEISQFIKNGFTRLRCPRGDGRYTINPVGRDPECSVHGALSEALQNARLGRVPENATRGPREE